MRRGAGPAATARPRRGRLGARVRLPRTEGIAAAVLLAALLTAAGRVESIAVTDTAGLLAQAFAPDSAPDTASDDREPQSARRREEQQPPPPPPPPAPARGEAGTAAREDAEPPPAEDVAGLARGLFPAAQDGGAVADLYPRLFPAGAPDEAAQTAEPVAAPEAPGARVGPFRLNASAAARYVDGDTFLGLTPTRDRYLEVAPKLSAEASLARGRFALEYDPVLRALATYDRVNDTTHTAGATVEVPLGGALTLHAGDRFASGTLETRLVDPGGEYFFGLGRFHRNDAEAGARVALTARLALELSGRAGRVRFVEPSTFFDHDTRAASAGLGFELTPGLRSRVDYVYDTIPRPDERPEAEAQAHSVNVSLDGDLRPLLSGQLSFGYRSQSNPRAGEGGRSYSGLTASGTLTQQLGRQSRVSLYLSRTTPASAFEANGFYVASSAQVAAQLPLPLSLELRGGLGWQSSSYRTAAVEIGAPRQDRLLDWSVGLRRPLPGRLAASASYRAERRRSNIGRFDVDSDGFVLQLEWDALGGGGR